MKSAAVTIDGLKLTMTGKELRDRLDKRIRAHEQRAERWKRELARTPEDQTEEAPLLPDHMCEQEMERATWRGEVLAFVRDGIEPEATYRLGEADLAFGELLPRKPGLVEQVDFEEAPPTRYELQRLTRAVERLSCGYHDVAPPGDRPVGPRRPERKGRAAKPRRRRRRAVSVSDAT